MTLRKLSAPRIYPIASEPVDNGALLLQPDGTVEAVLPSTDGLEDVEHFPGALAPGFINAHCHLELSHLRGLVPEKTGLIGFIKDMMAVRFNHTPESVQQAIAEANAEMLRNGIVAVGDITNGPETFAAKAASSIHYHSFIELFNFDDAMAEETMQRGRALVEQHQAEVSPHASLTPHAPYSVSVPLLKAIGENCYTTGAPISIHNQESAEENPMFLTGESAFLDMLRGFGLFTGSWKPTGFNSLPSVAVHLPTCNPLMFVHNTFSTAADIAWAHKYAKLVYWCTCPNANLYIEDRLPDYSAFLAADATMVIGTDSLASNHGLSILDELKTIAQHAPEIGFETLLKWATLNGATALNIHKQYGSFEAGKKPGVNHLLGLRANQQLTPDTRVEKVL